MITASNDSRFFMTSDVKSEEVVFPLPPSWWSRKYEYPWALTFVTENDVVLDAACGVSHPLKFALVHKAREVHAVDFDERILDKEALHAAVNDEFGPGAVKLLPPEDFNLIHFKRASICSLPYKTDTFDVVYCISVIEHLKDCFNRFTCLPVISPLRWLLNHEIDQAFGELSRVLKPGGLLVLTFDYPRINLHYVRVLVHKYGLKFCGDTDWNLPENAIISPDDKLSCFRALLVKG